MPLSSPSATKVPVRTLAPIGLAALALSFAAPGAAAGKGTPCVPKKPGSSWRAVFGHFASKAKANEQQKALLKSGFNQARVDEGACGGYEISLVGLDSSKVRLEFQREATKAGFAWVSFEPPAGPPGYTPGTYRAIFGHLATLAAADALERRAATSGFRVIGIERRSARDFVVVVWGIPINKAEEFGKQAQGAGFPIVYEVG